MTLLNAIGTGATVAITIKAIDEFSDTFGKAETSMGKIGTIAGGALVAGITATGVAITSLGISSIKSAANFEQTQIAFTTMLGSAEEAEKMLGKLAEFAKRTPFTLTGIEEQSKKLLAYGISSEELMGDIKALGDIAAGVGTEKLPQLTLAFGQVSAAGKLRGSELRQFTEAGVPLIDELAKHFNVTASEIQEMVSKGDVGFEDVRQSLISLTEEGGRFEDLMSKQAETVSGKISNLQDSFELIKRELGMAVIPAVSDLADTFLNDLLPSVEPILPVLIELFKDILTQAAPIIQKIMPIALELISVFAEIFDVFVPLLDPFADLSFAILPIFTNILKALIPIIRPLIAILTPFLEILAPIVELIGYLISGIAKIGGSILGQILNYSASGWADIGKRIGVGDAIIRPNGDIIETSPQDYLFATKNPESLTGNNGITIIIEGDINGTDPEQMAKAFARELKQTIRI